MYFSSSALRTSHYMRFTISRDVLSPTLTVKSITASFSIVKRIVHACKKILINRFLLRIM